MRKKVPDPQDIELFRQQVGGVRPLTRGKAEISTSPARRTVLRRPSENTHTVSQPTHVARHALESVTISNDTTLQFRRAGIQDRVFRRLQRGQYPIAADLDLHGMTAQRARLALDQFMHQVKIKDRHTCFRIIHGKGLGSKDGLPVIKREVQLWLQCNINVLAYSSCRNSDGGTGAIYVLVKQGT